MSDQTSRCCWRRQNSYAKCSKTDGDENTEPELPTEDTKSQSGSPKLRPELEDKTSLLRRQSSISGILPGHPRFRYYVIVLVIMIACGSTNDFFADLVNEIYEEKDFSNEDESKINSDYWITYMLELGTFSIGTFALLFPSARRSCGQICIDRSLIWKISIPSILWFFSEGAKYLAYIYLPAATVSALKSGTQLLFIAILRRWIHHKAIPPMAWCGIFVVLCGLVMISWSSVTISTNTLDAIIGIAILVGSGLTSAVKSDVEEILLKHGDYKLDPMFIFGCESLISLFFTVIVGIAMISIDEHVLDNIYSDFLSVPLIMGIFACFLVTIFGRKSTQMIVVQLSSALTKKMIQQIFPVGTWVLSVMCYYLFSNGVYGESVGKYTALLVGGFAVVIAGNVIYRKAGSKSKPAVVITPTVIQLTDGEGSLTLDLDRLVTERMNERRLSN